MNAAVPPYRIPVADLRAVREEVRHWDPALLERPQIVVAAKRDAVSVPDPLPTLQEEARRLGLEVRPVSAVTGEGLAELKRSLGRLVREAAAAGGPGGIGGSPSLDERARIDFARAKDGHP